MNAVVVIVVIVIVAVIAYLGYLKNKKRREAFAAWAASRGWTYAAENNAVIGQFEGEPFDRGDHQRAKNVVVGQFQNRPVIAFDYSYQTHSTDSEGHRQTTTHEYNIISVGLPVPLPVLQVSRESLFSKVGRAIGIRDIEFENEEFNRTFNVHCKDRKFASDLLHPRMMQWLLDSKGPAWRIDRSNLLCWESGNVSPEVIDQQLGYLSAIADQVPRFVWQDHGAGPPTQ